MPNIDELLKELRYAREQRNRAGVYDFMTWYKRCEELEDRIRLHNARTFCRMWQNDQPTKKGNDDEYETPEFQQGFRRNL